MRLPNRLDAGRGHGYLIQGLADYPLFRERSADNIGNVFVWVSAVHCAGIHEL
jgi:hypothetical protein